jgi:hypothetical protein
MVDIMMCLASNTTNSHDHSEDKQRREREHHNTVNGEGRFTVVFIDVHMESG